MIPKQTILNMIQDERDKIVMIREAKGVGITPAQVECEMKISTCEELLEVKVEAE